ncbi:anthranilate synthase component I family protein [Dyadobacter fanqingshengii]|uniref:Anthranilate synthase component 1 n=1 Tax=Dyadobacter fanqingshengii TaxID=2906443 RepID=A0A9X1PFW4_9BACT|nr:anthranilate synthase component I family protein [Dyadobacter fanqingshengii]MCF0043705.1 anthranilate synthase component I family protein [Dyadobacter fanqingshengii]USJ34923.1 anthranilate synthase component I family protein [Dyadobacter fanqingshengii]
MSNPTFQISTRHKKLLADTLTPVSIYLKLRDRFVNTILLESSDYHGNENSFTYICCDPVAFFKLNQNVVTQQFPDGQQVNLTLEKPKDAVQTLYAFAQSFKSEKSSFPFISNGLFGHMTYDAVSYFEDITIQPASPETDIDQIFYQVYRYVIAINHFKNELYIFEHQYGDSEQESGIEQIEILIKNRNFPKYDFQIASDETSNVTDDEMRAVIQKGIDHCLRGDVFQIVPSRRFSRNFQGDEFNVYRALRSINPSPYLFYFDYGSYKIFGSSPEKQIFIKNGQAEIHPIAGTFRRTGDDQADAEAAQALLNDPKETAEHVMLVDLARNDLSRSCDAVKVTNYKEVQYYSHVIHLVSKVVGKMNEGVNPLQLVADTFPAGTLSGAPKHNAMKLIDQMETSNRSIYGGAIGFMDFNGDFNHAIAIRTFLSKNNTLFFRAGMGVVAKSNVESELQEINSKLAALRKAIDFAEEI